MSVGLSVFFLSATRHLSTCGAASEWPREQEPPSRAAPHASRASMHSESTRAHAVQKNRSADAFQKQNRTRAHAVVYVRADIFKKREKENQHATSQVQFTVRLLLECLLFEYPVVLNSILHKSSLPAPMESRRTRRPTFTADERLERRGEQDRRRHAERRARERREQTQARRMLMWIACGLPKPVPRSTKTTIMTVHVNPIMQAAPSQRRIISISEASNQLLFHSQKLFFVE